jgi:Terminase small subunit
MEENKKEERELTLKQRKWIKLYIDSGNATEAAMQSYDCKDRESAATIGWENLRKLDYTDFMEAAGVTDKLLQEKLLEGLDSTKQIGARKIVQGARTGHEIKVDATTDTDDFIDVPDYAVRHKYLETALKLKKRLVEKHELEGELIIKKLVIIDTKPSE